MERFVKFAPFKLSHYRKLLQRLLERGDVKFITYNDLCWQQGDDHNNGYKLEFQSWIKKLKSGELDRKACYVLIQHDSDTGPLETVQMANLEEEYGIVSNLMIFSEWNKSLNGVFAKHSCKDHESVPVSDYPIDICRLQALARSGFVVGYHANPYHNSGFREELLTEYFERGLAKLRECFDINFFSPHGGRLDRFGKGNASFDYLIKKDYGLKWVHNSRSPSFHSAFSDGGLLGLSPDILETRNFFDWVDNLKPGTRNRLLIHPQYFCDDNFQFTDLLNVDWYRDLNLEI